MALLQTRGRLISAICGPVSTGVTGAVTAHTFARSVAGNWTDGGRVRNFDSGEATVVSAACTSKKSARPYGYLPPHSWVLPRTAGGIACNAGRIVGAGALAGSGAMGLNASAGLAGSSSMSGFGGMIVSAVAALTGSGTLTSADIRGIVSAAAALSGSGDLSAGVTALGHLLAALAGTSTLEAPLSATGTLAADILPYSDLSPQGLADSVWGALAAANNDGGTMGEKLNAAGTAGDPWTAALPASYAAGTAGYIVGTNLDQKVSDVAVVAVGAALNKRADSFVLTTGTEASGTYLDTYDLNAVYHRIAPVGNTLDCYYEMDVGADFAPVSASVVGRMAGKTNTAEVWAWHWGDGLWRQIGSLAGRDADVTATWTLFIAHVGTGADAGKVRVRFSDAGATDSLYIDQFWVSYAPLGTFNSTDRANVTDIKARAALVEKLLRNKTVTDPATGIITVYDDNGVDVLFTADIFEDAAGTEPYDGQGVNRRDRLA